MFVAAIVLLALGVGALGTSTYLEWRCREPVYALVMKVSTGLLAIGALLFSLVVGLGPG